jgi:hypothetical protein
MDMKTKLSAALSVALIMVLLMAAGAYVNKGTYSGQGLIATTY